MAYVSWIVTVLEEKAVHRRDHLTVSTCRAWLRRHPYPPHYARTARFRFKSTSSGPCSLSVSCDLSQVSVMPRIVVKESRHACTLKHANLFCSTPIEHRCREHFQGRRERCHIDPFIGAMRVRAERAITTARNAGEVEIAAVIDAGTGAIADRLADHLLMPPGDALHQRIIETHRRSFAAEAVIADDGRVLGEPGIGRGGGCYGCFDPPADLRHGDSGVKADPAGELALPGNGARPVPALNDTD